MKVRKSYSLIFGLSKRNQDSSNAGFLITLTAWQSRNCDSMFNTTRRIP